MKLQHILTVFLLATFFLSNRASAQSCDDSDVGRSTVVYYINGMYPVANNATKATTFLQTRLTPNFRVEHSENKFRSNYEQFIEVVRARINEPQQMWSWLGDFEHAPKWFRDHFTSLSRKATDSQNVNNVDLTKMINDYLFDLQSGKKVILIAHSQGNFFANSAYENIVSQFPEYANSISIIANGSPASRVLGGGTWYRNSLDLVIRAVDVLYEVLPSNFSYLSNIDFLNHGFNEVYLLRRGNEIVRDIGILSARLDFPPKHEDCDTKAIVETLPVASVGTNSAVLQAQLLAGSNVQVWFVISAGGSVFCSAGDRNGNGTYSRPDIIALDLTGLTQTEDYIYRACAIGPDGVLSSGTIMRFRTIIRTEPCGRQFTGGVNGLRTVVSFVPKERVINAPVTVSFQAFEIPDGVTIYKHPRSSNTPLFTSGGLVSGANSGNFVLPWNVDKVDVFVTANANIQTEWELRISCPNYP